MSPRRGSRLPMANETLLDNTEPVLIRPMPTANTISSGKNRNLRVEGKVGDNLGLTIEA